MLSVQAHNGPVFCLDHHPGGDRDLLATGARDRMIKVWDLDHATAGSSSAGSARDLMASAPSATHAKAIHTVPTLAAVAKVRWRPAAAGGDYHAWHIVSCAAVSDCKLHVWDVTRPSVTLHSLPGHKDVCSGFEFLPSLAASPASSEVVLSVSKDQTLLRHDLSVQPLPYADVSPSSLSWNPRGDLTTSSSPLIVSLRTHHAHAIAAAAATATSTAATAPLVAPSCHQSRVCVTGSAPPTAAGISRASSWLTAPPSPDGTLRFHSMGHYTAGKLRRAVDLAAAACDQAAPMGGIPQGLVAVAHGEGTTESDDGGAPPAPTASPPKTPPSCCSWNSALPLPSANRTPQVQSGIAASSFVLPQTVEHAPAPSTANPLSFTVATSPLPEKATQVGRREAEAGLDIGEGAAARILDGADLVHYLARRYRTHGASVGELCAENAAVARAAGEVQLAHTWLSLHFCLADPPKGFSHNGAEGWSMARGGNPEDCHVPLPQCGGRAATAQPRTAACMAAGLTGHCDGPASLHPTAEAPPLYAPRRSPILGLREDLAFPPFPEAEANRQLWNDSPPLSDCSPLRPPSSLGDVIPGIDSFDLLKPIVLSVLEYHSDRGDVQTCAVITQVLQDVVPDLIGRSRVQRWQLGYIDLLQRLCLFDLANDVIKRSDDERVRKARWV